MPLIKLILGYVVLKSLRLPSYDELPLVTKIYTFLLFKLTDSINVFIIVGAVYHHTGKPINIVL